MEFRTVERYYPVTQTKRSELCKTKQFSKSTIETLEQGVKYVQS